ncbi:MAG: hypothetical protein LUH01_17640 [Parabacteroides gordonii]|nr:hypothetical protein [Parabacteroides gordonii]
MRIVAIKSFRNKETQEIYSPGDVVSTFTEARATDVVARGLAVILNEKTLEPASESATLHLNNDGAISFGAADTAAPANTGTAAGVEDAPKSVLQTNDIDMTQQWQKVVAAVKSFEDVEKLKGYLSSENASEKPRTSVVVALEARIAELSNKA